MSLERPGNCLSRLGASCPPAAPLLGLAGRPWTVVLWLALCFGSGLLVVSPHGRATEQRSPVDQTPDKQAPEDQAPEERAEEDRFVTESLRGRIVWMAEALERRFGIQTVPEAQQRLLALETGEGELHPIAEDIRGRAFRRDERLRGLADCELLARRFHGSPMIQVIRLYSHENDTRYELDYWCEICAITLFELKPCDCCQGDIELRRREAP